MRETDEELKANARAGYVINCTIIGRKGENPLPLGVPHLDGYHVVPSERFVKLESARNEARAEAGALREALEAARDCIANRFGYGSKNNLDADVIEQADAALIKAARENLENSQAMLDLINTARRVYWKYGEGSDWTEWTDLRDALNALGSQQVKP